MQCKEIATSPLDGSEVLGRWPESKVKCENTISFVFLPSKYFTAFSLKEHRGRPKFTLYVFFGQWGYWNTRYCPFLVCLFSLNPLRNSLTEKIEQLLDSGNGSITKFGFYFALLNKKRERNPTFLSFFNFFPHEN